MQGFSREDLKNFKSKYQVSTCFGTRQQKDDGLTTDERFQKMALASKQKIFLNNKNTDYNQRLPFKGQQNPGRYLPLSHVEDHEQLHNIRGLLKKMEKDLTYFLTLYEDDAEK